MCIVFINIIVDSIMLLGDNFFIPPGLFRILATLVIILSHYRIIIKNKYSHYILIMFFFYSFLALANSTDPAYSLTSIVKFLTPFICYPLTVEFLKRFKKNNFYFENSILISAFYITLLLTISQIYKLGESPYIDDFFYLGGFNIQITYTIAYSIIFLLFIYSFNLKKYFFKKTSILAIIILTFLLILIFRRVAIISAVLSFVFFIFYYYKINLFKIFIISGFTFITLNFFFQEKLNIDEVIEKRQKNSLSDEGRYKELILIIEDMRGNVINIFLGNELFNSQNFFKKNNVYRMENQEQLHTDLATLLHGAGISGLLIYILFIVSMIKNAFKHAAKKHVFFPAIPLILSYFLFSFSGQYYIFTSLTIFCIFLGFFKSYNFNNIS